MLKPELAKQRIRGRSATLGGTAMRLLQDLKGGVKKRVGRYVKQKNVREEIFRAVA